MSILNQYGWNAWFRGHNSIYKEQNLLPGRIISVHGHQYALICENGEWVAELSGSMINSKASWELPKVGDWVVFMPYDELGYIIEVLPRQNELSRKMPGTGTEKQVIATNIDFAIIIQGLDRDFNPMRLQRYLHQVIKSNIKPIVVLNKRDLVKDPATYEKQVLEMGHSCPVILTSSLSNEGMEALKEKHINSGKTYVLLGSSGVGKSTLINALFGSQLQATGGISDVNKKGKHTTTSRNLFIMPDGSLIIDTPGMREFGITEDTEDAAVSYHPQIDELAFHCKFPDCTHQHEPGCAVVQALKEGSLLGIVYKSYVKLLKEEHRNQVSAEEKKRAAKKFGRMGKEAKVFRKKRKF